MQASLNQLKFNYKTLLGAVLFSVAATSGCGAGGSAPRSGPSPPLASVAPEKVSGSHQVLTLTFSDPKGVDHLKSARLLVNGVVDGRKACYVYYDHVENAFLLVNDSGEGSTRMTAGTAESIGNNQCRISGGGSSVSASGNDLIIRLDLALSPDFSGPKHLFLASEDKDGHTTQFQSLGTWTVP